MARINRVEIQGFRAFGKELQTIDIPSRIAILWGPNSQGKTSLAEAIEFLLTGSIVRRELLASSQDEFADSLRNAHMPAGLPVFVQAEIVDADGKAHLIKRTLVSDYTKKASCASTLEIDGARADQAGLVKLGVVLSQPPMAAPVLMQHTLGYLFSAKPQERSMYFKALLEVSDLDTLRAKIADREPFLNRAESPVLAKLRICASQPVLKPSLEPLLETSANAPQVDKALIAAATALLTSAGATVPATQAERLKMIEDLLAEKRARTFPLSYFDLKPLKPWESPKEQSWSELENFIVQAGKLAAETKRLIALFTEVLKIPGVPEIKDPVTCPVCETLDALTPARIGKIREQLQASEDYRKAQTAAQNALRQIETASSNLKQSIAAASPQLFQSSGSKRKKAGFSSERMQALLLPDHLPLVETWRAALISLAKERRSIRRVIASAATAAKGYLADLDTLSE
jgi:DNA repair exonuclease SbcCD ATPase subunit